MENGYRAYSEHDVHRLITVQKLVQDGFTVHQAIAFLQNGSATTILATNPLASEDLSSTLDEMLQYGERLDSEGLDRLLARCAEDSGLYILLNDLLPAFLKRVGELWEAGDWSEHQEHISSQVIRDFLIHVRSTLRTKMNGPLLLGSCVPHERHEIPVQMLLTRAAMEGWRTVSLGSSPAESAIEKAICDLSPTVVVLSVLTTQPFDDHPNLLKTLDEMARRIEETPVYIGGQGIERCINQGIQLRGLKFAKAPEDIVELNQATQIDRLN